MLAGDPAQLGAQPGFLVRAVRASQPMSRAVRTDHSAGATFGDPEP
jgi:hypothetical protein